MSTHDPIRRSHHPHPQRTDARQAQGFDPGLEDARQCARGAQVRGYIRGYASVEHSSGRSELEIELKYFDGEPVIREIERVSKPGRASLPPRSRTCRA
ncbi:MAG: 30S ribosomal protein S8 [Bradyrhizobium sp.]